MNILAIFLYIAILIFSVVIHEVSHGKVADELGDPTARLSGRLTLNPIPHLDLFGSIILPLILIFSGTGFLFAWAKPVPFDPYNLKNPRRDSALISLAGPGANLFLAIVSSILLHLFTFFSFPFIFIIGSILVIIIKINVFLALFNLLPIAPLDGFKIVGGILPEEKAKEWYQLERYGMIFLLMLIFPLGNSGSMIDIIIRPVISFFMSFLIPMNIAGGIM